MYIYTHKKSAGIKIKKVPAFQPVSEDFFIKWEEILYNVEKNLAELLLYESSKVIAKIEIDFSNEIYKLHPDDYKTKRNELTNNNMLYKKQLEKRSSKKWHNLKKENETSPKETGAKLTTTLANSSGKPNTQNQSENVHTNHISVDKKFESTKEKCEIRSLKEAPTSVMNISTKFITDNRKARLKKSKTYCEVLKSSQAQDYSRSGENVMNLEAIKKDLLSSENSSIISTSPPALCTNTSSSENSSAYKCNSSFL